MPDLADGPANGPDPADPSQPHAAESSASTDDPPRRAAWRTRAVTVGLGLLLTVFAAWAANFALDYSTLSLKGGDVVHHILALPARNQSIVLVWLIVVLVVAVIGRLWVSLGLLAALTVLLGVVNHTKLVLRNDPLVPSDTAFLTQPGFLVDMVPLTKVILGAVGLVVVVVVAWLVGRWVARWLPSVSHGLTGRSRYAWWGVRAVVAMICLLLLVPATNFNEPGNRWKKAYDATGLRWRYWDQRVNYERNGFVAGALFNMPVSAMDAPPGYSRAKVEEVVDRYTALAAQENAKRAGTLADTNVVIILSESFTDPTWLKTVHYPIDPIPKIRDLMSRTVSGRMLAPGFGGGTANVEFELLTGQSLSQFKPQLATPYEQLVPHQDEYPSAVGYFESTGHKPIAIHPFSPRMYSRPEVYDILGFDEFITKDQMVHTSHGGGRFIDDDSLFDEALDQIEANDQPVLLHLISMQNHMPYGGQYDDPINPTGLSPRNNALAGQYARGLSRTDDALTSFLAELADEAEPTVVIFYGDHLPAQVYPANLIQREGQLTAHQTPYLIWSNTRDLPHTDLPTTSPTQFLPLMFQAMGAKVPAYYALLDALRTQIPAIDGGHAITPDDRRIPLRKLSPEARDVLADYHLIQYDLSIGKHYGEQALFAPPAG